MIIIGGEEVVRGVEEEGGGALKKEEEQEKWHMSAVTYVNGKREREREGMDLASC